jgi:hypothetical protein
VKINCPWRRATDVRLANCSANCGSLHEMAPERSTPTVSKAVGSSHGWAIHSEGQIHLRTPFRYWV